MWEKAINNVAPEMQKNSICHTNNIIKDCQQKQIKILIKNVSLIINLEENDTKDNNVKVKDIEDN